MKRRRARTGIVRQSVWQCPWQSVWRVSAWFVCARLVWAWLVWPTPALAEDAGAAQGPDAGAAVAVPRPDPRTLRIRALMDGRLDVAIEPQALFDVPLTDEKALGVEAVRLRALLRVLTPGDGVALSGKPAASAEPGLEAVAAAPADLEAFDRAEWGARLGLDRARLDFYSLPGARREELLRSHAARREAAKPRESEEQRRAREAERERQRALRAAREARSEAERVVREEEARLIGVEQAIAAVRAQFDTVRDELASRLDAVFGWQRRARDAKQGSTADADAAYAALRRTLRVSRDELALALDALASGFTRVPSAGLDRLGELPPDIAVESIAERRRGVEEKIREALVLERELLEARATALLEEMKSLNAERLGLLPYLSVETRGSITGFTEAGFDQARAEARHLLLVLQYHRHIVTDWIQSSGTGAGLRGVGLWRLAFVIVPCVLAVSVFVWWRRRSPALLGLLEERVIEEDRQERRTEPSLRHKALQFLRSVHRTLEWLLLFAALVWLLPGGARALLEVQLLILIMGWSLAAALVVNSINAFASMRRAPGIAAGEDAGGLRLRSLRLVGRVIVSFVLVLLISKRLVGEGTVHQWVWSTCWFAAIPVFLVLVRWWRETIFQRLDRARRKSPTQAWVLANRSGWKSFFAAMIAAVHLFVQGTLKVGRNWLASFNLARRAHAYLFKRELDRLEHDKPRAAARVLNAEALAALSPERPTGDWVACAADDPFGKLLSRAASGAGGVVALVGGRGAGKSSLLQRLAQEAPGARLMRCDDGLSATHIGAEILSPASANADPARRAPRLALVDDAHALIKPILGGLQTFDECLALARAHGAETLWVLAIDEVVWPFLQRARDARPLFDQVIFLRPWTEEQIGALLSQRSAAASVVPNFEDLLEELPPGADEIDRQEALSAKRLGYFRMVWDYARGNPAIALEVWRSSLREDSGGTVRVRPLQTPGTAELEALPDSSLFILRAILQIGPASVNDLAEVTRLTAAQVQDAVGFGKARGYLIEEVGKTLVSWAWLRAVMHLLERRHLLVKP